MKLILYAWGSNSDNILKDSLISLGYGVTVYSRKCVHYTKDLKMAQELINLVHEVKADGVISFDYFPLISMVCNTAGILYYSWVYDCPHYTLFAKTAGYGCNRIGCFDSRLTDRLNSLGFKTVFHLLLGVNWPEINNMDAGKYQCDVSFVGSLYTGKYDYYESIYADEWLKKRADECIEKQCFDYERDHIGEFFRNYNEEPDLAVLDKIRDILADQKLLLGDEYIEDTEYTFASSFLEKKVTIEERKRLLNAVAGIGCDFRLYTGSELKDEPKLKKVCEGYVDYAKAMPKVFKNSRINLNITLRSIRTGIPLRALDIMGCGGFLLSNYQKELGDYFEENKEMVMFYSLEDCIEKIGYYLLHEDERKKIAQAGFNAVRDRFSCEKQVEKLLLT